MSSILLSNPFAIPPNIQNLPAAAAPLAVTPMQSTSPTQDQSNSTSFGGSGTGTTNQNETVTLFRRYKNATLQDATVASVISAQAVPLPAKIDLGSKLPEVEMPDPLPTSPFLKRD